MDSARRVPELEHSLKRCYEQLDAVRVIQTQLMDKYQELYKLLNYVNGIYGVIVGLDEIQNWFQSGLNKMPAEMLEVVTQNRKNRRVMYCTAQVFTRVNKGLREQVTLVYNPHTFLGCPFLLFLFHPCTQNPLLEIYRNAICPLQSCISYVIIW